MASRAAEFAELGHLGPIRVLSRRDCRRFLRAVDLRPAASLDWDKGVAATSRAYFEVATCPEVVDVVAELLGGDAVLWGASIQRRVPNAVHAWHSDIESSAPDARSVSVWIGLENTTPASSLIVLPHSHLFGVTVQQVRHENGKARDEASLDDLVAWARERDSRSELVTLGVTDGEAVVFDGRLWHGTHNVSRRTRRALLLQYAAPGTAIRIPDLNRLDWPFRQLETPRPACLIVSGRAIENGVNRIVPAPVEDTRARIVLTSRIHPLRLPLDPDPERGWKPYPAFSGATADLPSISCHASVLSYGATPHPPHRHDEEELLLVLAGELEVVRPGHEPTPLRPGEFVYYPAGLEHTLHATAETTYVMLKWSAERPPADGTLPFGRFVTGGDSRVLFEGPTRYLRKLHSHVTVLGPGEGYEPHADAYDVAIVVLEGELETIGGRASSHDVIFYRAGEPHGMHNVGAGPARYVVFELHGRRTLAGRAPGIARALVSPRYWKGKLKNLLRR